MATSEVGGLRPSTCSPSRLTMATSSGSSRSYWLELGVQANRFGSPCTRTEMLPAVE